ncbi:GHMP kinase [bacterium]|nr:GHMP kinase [bacterium]
MRMVRTVAHARAGLVGNPSDGYFGKTIAVIVRDFSARIVLYEWPTQEILPSGEDHVRFDSLEELADDVRRNGYYGGLRLVKASIKKFYDYCVETGVNLPRRNFSVRYETDVPRQVGLAGSSAIITAAFRALMRFYDVSIPREILPNWILATEREELGISGGLQDRVCQVYEGLVYMDFAREKLERDGYGDYQPLDPALLPPLYLAYQVKLAEVSEIVHNDLRRRWERGDPEVHEAMRGFAALTDRFREALLAGRREELAEIMNANFDLRRRIVPISRDNLELVETGRASGASAKFAGSGGAIVGTYPDEAAFRRLTLELAKLDCRVIRPTIL